MVFADARDAAVVLAEVVSVVDAMHDPVGIAHETFDPLRHAERARHLESVERVRLERLACAILIRMRTCVDVLVLLFGARVERIAQILALKRAGLSLAQIQRLTARRPLDLKQLILAQLEALASQEAEIAEARALLLHVKSRIDRGEPVDAATFCSLIRNGDAVMAAENWKNVTDRYYSEAEKEEWASRMPALPEGFDMEAYNRQWTELGAKIEAALPISPPSRTRLLS